MGNIVVSFMTDQSGATAVEGGLIVALMATAVIGCAKLLGSDISATFFEIAVALGLRVIPDHTAG